MTGKERLTNIINSKPADRLSWTTLVDDITRSIMPENVKNLDIMDFYRYIGCDIMQFGNYGLNETDCIKYPYKLLTPQILETENYIDDNGYNVVKRKTKYGDLVNIYRNGHPIKYPVQSIEDVRILSKIWMDASCIVDEDGCIESYDRMDRIIGKDGIFVPTSEPSPFQTLLEFEIGIENFYYLLNDYKEEMEELISVMNQLKLQEYRIIAEKAPFETCIPVENTSTSNISPKIYREYCLPFMQNYVELMHKNNKKAIIHMCGLLNNILPDIKETGLDGIHAVTIKPLGDVEYDRVLDILGDKLVIITGIESSVFMGENSTSEDIIRVLDRVITPRLRESNIVWACGGDGIPMPLERYLVVKEWMEKYG